MPFVNDIGTSFTGDVTATNEVVIQCRRGTLFVNWAAVAPGDIRDSLALQPGEVAQLPAGTTFRFAAPATDPATAWYEEL